VPETSLFPMTNAHQESSFAVYKGNQRQFMSLRELNLRGQSFARVNGLLDWICDKPNEEIDLLIRSAAASRTAALQADTDRLIARALQYFPNVAVNERLI
jgi:hypothetical protein